jgi:hypothetical protein
MKIEKVLYDASACGAELGRVAGTTGTFFDN